MPEPERGRNYATLIEVAKNRSLRIPHDGEMTVDDVVTAAVDALRAQESEIRKGRLTTVLVAVAAVALGAFLGYDAGFDRGQDTAWTSAETRAWRVRASGACDGAYDGVTFLGRAVVGVGDGDTIIGWEQLARRIGRMPEAYSPQVRESLPRGAVIGWASAAFPVEVGESVVAAAFSSAGIPADRPWSRWTLGRALADFSFAPVELFEGLCRSDYPLLPTEIGP